MRIFLTCFCKVDVVVLHGQFYGIYLPLNTLTPQLVFFLVFFLMFASAISSFSLSVRSGNQFDFSVSLALAASCCWAAGFGFCAISLLF